MRRILANLVLAVLMSAFGSALAAPSGAIFTTLSDGSEVNLNQFPSKEAVYLDGGPGIGAPQTAAGLDDGIYVFQVTDPSGKRLLSEDVAACRRFVVSAGIISAVVPAGGCEHLTGVDVDHGAVTVQLMPYLDTPNPGGVYKAWAVPVADFLAGCAELGVPDGLTVVDCGYNAGNFHGFLPADSKTDNFKVKVSEPREVDVKFHDRLTGAPLDGRYVIWIDTLGAGNVKWQYLVKTWGNHEAHVESMENGTHRFLVPDQPGCIVESVNTLGLAELGPTTVEVQVRGAPDKRFTQFIDVYCYTSSP